MEAGHGAGKWPILVVDDEEGIRRLIALMLSQEGYRVLEAEDGQAAYDIVRQERGCLMAVITDVQMPRMSGPELVAHLRAGFPEVKIIFMSAYPPEALAADDNFIAKPFKHEALLAIVRDVLASSPSRLDRAASEDPSQ